MTTFSIPIDEAIDRQTRSIGIAEEAISSAASSVFLRGLSATPIILEAQFDTEIISVFECRNLSIDASLRVLKALHEKRHWLLRKKRLLWLSGKEKLLLTLFDEQIGFLEFDIAKRKGLDPLDRLKEADEILKRCNELINKLNATGSKG